MEEKKEVEFMSRYVWGTLLALYDRLGLSNRLKLRNVSNDLEVDPELAEALKVTALFHRLLEAVKRVLNRLQFLFVEELKLEKYEVRGRVAVKLCARYLPNAVPVRITRSSVETPANLLVVLTLLEVREKALKSARLVAETSPVLALKPLREMALEQFERIVSLCDYLLADPALRPLISRARLMIGSVGRIEKEVAGEAVKRPREYRAYARLLEYRRLLKERMVLVERKAGELRKLLTLDVSPAKLYELFGFTVLLEGLIDILKVDNAWRVKVDKEGRALFIDHGDLRVVISYNTILEDVRSRFEAARAYGIFDGKIGVKKLKGIPDTMILFKKDNCRRLMVVDYKYSRNLSYHVVARFKVYSYLNEYDADIAVVVAPSPKPSKLEDEEAVEQSGFYQAAAKHGGAVIHINNNGKIIAFLYLDANDNSISATRNAISMLIRLLDTK
ncbi:MAG: hypothetical protein J7L38_03015 [Thermoproteales archaeon]|nr:hypothetical protein [Thermoproteales archaeon]